MLQLRSGTVAYIRSTCGCDEANGSCWYNKKFIHWFIYFSDNMTDRTRGARQVEHMKTRPKTVVVQGNTSADNISLTLQEHAQYWHTSKLVLKFSLRTSRGMWHCYCVTQISKWVNEINTKVAEVQMCKVYNRQTIKKTTCELESEHTKIDTEDIHLTQNSSPLWQSANKPTRHRKERV